MARGLLAILLGFAAMAAVVVWLKDRPAVGFSQQNSQQLRKLEGLDDEATWEALESRVPANDFERGFKKAMRAAQKKLLQQAADFEEAKAVNVQLKVHSGSEEANVAQNSLQTRCSFASATVPCYAVTRSGKVLAEIQLMDSFKAIGLHEIQANPNEETNHGGTQLWLSQQETDQLVEVIFKEHDIFDPQVTIWDLPKPSIQNEKYNTGLFVGWGDRSGPHGIYFSKAKWPGSGKLKYPNRMYVTLEYSNSIGVINLARLENQIEQGVLTRCKTGNLLGFSVDKSACGGTLTLEENWPLPHRIPVYELLEGGEFSSPGHSWISDKFDGKQTANDLELYGIKVSGLEKDSKDAGGVLCCQNYVDCKDQWKAAKSPEWVAETCGGSKMWGTKDEMPKTAEEFARRYLLKKMGYMEVTHGDAIWSKDSKRPDAGVHTLAEDTHGYLWFTLKWMGAVGHLNPAEQLDCRFEEVPEVFNPAIGSYVYGPNKNFNCGPLFPNYKPVQSVKFSPKCLEGIYLLKTPEALKAGAHAAIPFYIDETDGHVWVNSINTDHMMYLQAPAVCNTCYADHRTDVKATKHVVLKTSLTVGINDEPAVKAMQGLMQDNKIQNIKGVGVRPGGFDLLEPSGSCIFASYNSYGLVGRIDPPTDNSTDPKDFEAKWIYRSPDSHGFLHLQLSNVQDNKADIWLVSSSNDAGGHALGDTTFKGMQDSHTNTDALIHLKEYSLDNEVDFKELKLENGIVVGGMPKDYTGRKVYQSPTQKSWIHRVTLWPAKWASDGQIALSTELLTNKLFMVIENPSAVSQQTLVEAEKASQQDRQAGHASFGMELAKEVNKQLMGWVHKAKAHIKKALQPDAAGYAASAI